MDGKEKGFSSQAAAAASDTPADASQRTNNSSVAAPAASRQGTSNATAQYLNHHRQLMASAMHGLTSGPGQQQHQAPPQNLYRPLQTNGYSYPFAFQPQQRAQGPPRPYRVDHFGREYLKDSAYAHQRMKEQQPVVPPGIVHKPPPPGAPYTQLMSQSSRQAASAPVGPTQQLPQQYHFGMFTTTQAQQLQQMRRMAELQRRGEQLRLLDATTDQLYDEMEQVMMDAQKSLANGSDVTLLASDLTEIPLYREPPDYYDPLFLLHLMESFEVVVVHRAKAPLYCRELFNEAKFHTASGIVLIQCRFCHGSCQTNVSSPFLAVDKSTMPDDLVKTLLPMVGHTMSCPKSSMQLKHQLERVTPRNAAERSEVGASGRARCREWLAWIRSQLVYEQVLDMVPPGRHLEFWVPYLGKEMDSLEPDRKKQRLLDEAEARLHELVSSAGEHDVLYGFDGARACPGNQNLLRLVEKKRFEFAVAGKPQKSKIVSDVIGRVRHNGGKFLLVGENASSRDLSEREIQNSVELMLQRRSSSSVSFVSPEAAPILAPGSKVRAIVEAPVRDLISGKIRGYEPVVQKSRRRISEPRRESARRSSFDYLDDIDASSTNDKSTSKGSRKKSPTRPLKNASKIRSAYGQENDSKYSMARMMEGVKQDGSIRTASAPVRNKDGRFKRPPGRGRTGMEWDDIRGVWTPCKEQSENNAPHRNGIALSLPYDTALKPKGSSGHDSSAQGKPKSVPKPAKFSPDLKTKSGERPSKKAVWDIDLDDWVSEESTKTTEGAVKPPSASVATNGRARGVSSSDED